MAAFIAYGSLVPFTFHARPLDDVSDAFIWSMINRARIESRSDGIANVLIAVPLGFALLGMSRVERAGWRGDVIVGLAWLPPCVALAAVVEFGQLFVSSRTCAGSDVWCQGLGASIGMVGWAVFGRALTEQMRIVWGRTQQAGQPGRLLMGYLTLLAFIHVLPLDLNPSPAGLYRKVRDGGVRIVPFEEFHGVSARVIWIRAMANSAGVPGLVPEMTEDQTWEYVGRLVQAFGLYLPAGLLAGQLPGCFWGRLSSAAAVAVLVAVFMEAVQLPVQSRSPSATDVVVGTIGALAGWGIGRQRNSGSRAERAIALAQMWVALLLLVYWQPFDFRGSAAKFDWSPGLPLEAGNPLFALEELLTKLVLFAPLGALVATIGRGTIGRGHLAAAAGVGTLVSGVIELGQLFLRAHTPCITDVILGTIGAFVGAWVADRAGVSGEGTSRLGVY